MPDDLFGRDESFINRMQPTYFRRKEVPLKPVLVATELGVNVAMGSDQNGYGEPSTMARRG